MAVMFFLSSTPAYAQGQPDGWLEKPLANWNRPGARIPQAPTNNFGIDTDVAVDVRLKETHDHCEGLVRSPVSAEDRSLFKAGWLPFDPQQKLNGTTVVSALTTVDGMCRPLGYQVFVFVDERFAGTASPSEMIPRSTGAEITVRIEDDSLLTADFALYGGADPMCCPSRVYKVEYKVERRGGMPLLVPISVSTASATPNTDGPYKSGSNIRRPRAPLRKQTSPPANRDVESPATPAQLSKPSSDEQFLLDGPGKALYNACSDRQRKRLITDNTHDLLPSQIKPVEELIGKYCGCIATSLKVPADASAEDATMLYGIYLEQLRKPGSIATRNEIAKRFFTIALAHCNLSVK